MGFRGFARVPSAHHTRGSDRARRSRRAPARFRNRRRDPFVRQRRLGVNFASRRTSPRSSPATSACGASWSPGSSRRPRSSSSSTSSTRTRPASCTTPSASPSASRSRGGWIFNASPTPRDRSRRRGSRRSVGRDPARGRTRLRACARLRVRRGTRRRRRRRRARRRSRGGSSRGCAVGRRARVPANGGAAVSPFAGRARCVGWPRAADMNGSWGVVKGPDAAAAGRVRVVLDSGSEFSVLPRSASSVGRRRVNAESLERTSRRSSLVLAVRFSALPFPTVRFYNESERRYYGGTTTILRLTTTNLYTGRHLLSHTRSRRSGRPSGWRRANARRGSGDAIRRLVRVARVARIGHVTRASHERLLRVRRILCRFVYVSLRAVLSTVRHCCDVVAREHVVERLRKVFRGSFPFLAWRAFACPSSARAPSPRRAARTTPRPARTPFLERRRPPPGIPGTSPASPRRAARRPSSSTRACPGGTPPRARARTRA